jgi:hypothetical protein
MTMMVTTTHMSQTIPRATCCIPTTVTVRFEFVPDIFFFLKNYDAGWTVCPLADVAFV